MIKIVVAEDHALVRLGLVLMLESSGRYSVVAETPYGSGVETLIADTQADLLLLDLALSDCSGLEVAAQVRSAFPNVKILVVTGNAYAGSVANAFAAGANGFLVKHAQGEELLNAIDAVMTGARYVSPEVGGTGAFAQIQEMDGDRRLTAREQQIVRMIARGSTNHEIADALHISVLTARKHRQNVMLKLNLHNGAEIAAYAIQAGLMEAPDIKG